jgi:hypothetical protein
VPGPQGCDAAASRMVQSSSAIQREPRNEGEREMGRMAKLAAKAVRQGTWPRRGIVETMASIGED